MTRKADPTPPQPAEPEVPSGQHPHALPTQGGCFILVDGALLPDPAATTTPDPEV